MKRLYFVEPIVAVYAFSSFLTYPLVQQYVYRRLWLELTNTTYPISENTSRCDNTNISGNHSNNHEAVQKQASLFSLYTELFSTIPSLVVTLILVSYSDKRGRKITIILPLIGSLLYNLSFLVVSFFELNVYLLIGSSLLSSLFGGLGTFLGGCFAYVADQCEEGRQKTLRMAGIDMVIGLLSGGASLSTGYFLRAAGFNWPFLTSALCQCVTLLYAVFILEETVKKPSSDAINLNDPPCHSALKNTVYGIYQLVSGADRRSNVLLSLLLLTLSTYAFINIGGPFSITLYELNEPLCWSEILIGYGTALSTTLFLTSFLGVWALTYCRVPQLVIALIGVLSGATGLILVAFAKTTLFMFLVRVPMFLAIMPYPVLRSMMSKIISKEQQGALFACVSFLDSLSGNVAVAVFSSIYAGTVAWFPGFSFLLAAGLCLIPLTLLGVMGLLGVEDAKESEALIINQEDPAEDEIDHALLD